jgi:hypothetical protein
MSKNNCPKLQVNLHHSSIEQLKIEPEVHSQSLTVGHADSKSGKTRSVSYSGSGQKRVPLPYR